ncbi:hypothetical protein BDV95DRAFT_58101 [Massariosphaeria phaeospora]|uniref:Ubiquitin-like protease family profile domain-containing protein n=1 Tax=Massariosphaeria phaeospora TaxID=100035 RepID=A0A7C8I5E7_9PLEO|nr:hypothetical protein BDV95DRAFT_58101 [Massariosphaeria phaeospora]
MRLLLTLRRALQYGTGRRRALVEFSDLPRLDEEEFLNDSLLDFYLIYLFDQANLPPNKVYFFNTHFFTTLTRNTGRNSKINYPAVERWTSREDIFGYDYIVVPINENIHWYLAIICNVSNISRKFDLNSLDDLGESPPPPPTQVTRNDEHTDERHAPTPPHTADLQGTPVDGRNDEEMLFNIHEDTEIDLVDTNTVVHDNDAKEDSKTTGLTSETGIAGLEKLHITESIPEENLDNPASSAAPEKRKTKRKVGPPQKKFNPKEPIIIVLDSLGQNHSTAVRALKDYLLEEGKSKRGMEASITQNGFYAKNTHIPMQENYSDCGVFLLGYAQKFLDSPDDFVERILSNQMESEKDWPDMKASNLRDEMRSTLLRLGGEQQAERKRTRLDKKGRMPAPLPVEADSSMGHVKPTLLSPITLKPAQTGSTSQPASKPTFGAADTGGSPAKMPRKYSPMVVIPSPKRPYAQLDGTYQQNERHMLPEEQQHSPKRQKMEPNVRRSLSKSPAKIPPTHSKVIAPTTDLAHDMRGSSYDPISIDDSQDTIVVATPKVVHRSGPRTQLRSRSPMEAMQRRENSVNNAIKSPSNSPVQVRQSVEKETYPGDELIAKLKSPAKSTSRKHRSLSKTYVSEKLGAKQEKHMADEGEGFHEESTVDDGVIGETPPQEQASPPASEWKEGDALLL